MAGHSLVRRLSTLPSAGGGISRLACARAKEAGIDWKELVSAAGLTIKQIEDRDTRFGARNQILLLKLVADALQDVFESGGCDGFVVMPATLPTSHEQFCRAVVPELQRRKLFRTEYSASTLRGNLFD